uniref:Uncharacterized protein n=1 Tax=Rhizophora mucronata TaxID=61149 RepID=A0A2P2IZN4_RHIMU
MPHDSGCVDFTMDDKRKRGSFTGKVVYSFFFPFF